MTRADNASDSTGPLAPMEVTDVAAPANATPTDQANAAAPTDPTAPAMSLVGLHKRFGQTLAVDHAGW